MSRRPRRQFTPEQKAALVQRHLIDKVPVSQLCNENDLQPSLFYEWLRVFQTNVAAVFLPTTVAASAREKQLEGEVATLKAKVARKDEVIATVTQMHVELKKSLGET